MCGKVTHLVANCCSGEKYRYATTFRVPVVGVEWVHSAWEQRHDPAAPSAADSDIVSNYKTSLIFTEFVPYRNELSSYELVIFYIVCVCDLNHIFNSGKL